jgi:hypothetical protein
MADIVESEGRGVTLDLQLKAYSKNGEEIDSTAMSWSFVRSDDTYVYSFNNVQGTYFITVETNIDANITFLLLKDSLTHISPSANHFFDK